jgi:hypothetical protein
MKGIELLKSILRKYKWTIIGLIVVGLLFPFGLNWLVMRQSSFAIAGKPETWIAFWPSYLSAIASFGMIALTAITLLFNSETLKTNKEALEYNKEALKNNKEQLDELKRQWEEEHKPNVSVSFHRIGLNGYLRIINISNAEIKDLGIEIVEIPEGSTIRKAIEMYPVVKENIEVKHMYIEPRGIRNVILAAGFCNELPPYEYIGLKLKYNSNIENTIRVTFNQSYSIGDDIIGRELVDCIDRLRGAIKNIS